MTLNNPDVDSKSFYRLQHKLGTVLRNSDNFRTLRPLNSGMKTKRINYKWRRLCYVECCLVFGFWSKQNTLEITRGTFLTFLTTTKQNRQF